MSERTLEVCTNGEDCSAPRCSQVASHIARVPRCGTKCSGRVSNLEFERRTTMIARHYCWMHAERFSKLYGVTLPIMVSPPVEKKAIVEHNGDGV